MIEPAWSANWAWGLPLVAVTLLLHALGVVLIAVVMSRLRTWTSRRIHSLSMNGLLAGMAIGAVGCALAVLHGIEAGIWAVGYLLLGATESFADSMLYSLDSLTTRGESGLRLQAHWRLLGALEATDGVLLFGVSTAFLFAVIERAWQTLQQGANDHRFQKPRSHQ